jgi:hypothetical protein
LLLVFLKIKKPSSCQRGGFFVDVLECNTAMRRLAGRLVQSDPDRRCDGATSMLVGRHWKQTMKSPSPSTACPIGKTGATIEIPVDGEFDEISSRRLCRPAGRVVATGRELEGLTGVMRLAFSRWRRIFDCYLGYKSNRARRYHGRSLPPLVRHSFAGARKYPGH